MKLEEEARKYMKDKLFINELLTPDKYEDLAGQTAIFPKEKALEYLALGMTSEAGEVAGKVKKLIRDGEDVEGFEMKKIAKGRRDLPPSHTVRFAARAAGGALACLERHEQSAAELPLVLRAPQAEPEVATHVLDVTGTSSQNPTGPKAGGQSAKNASDVHVHAWAAQNYDR